MHGRDGERAELFFYLSSRSSFYLERGAECRVSGGSLPGAALLVCMLAGREGERPLYIFLRFRRSKYQQAGGRG